MAIWHKIVVVEKFSKFGGHSPIHQSFIHKYFCFSLISFCISTNIFSAKHILGTKSTRVLKFLYFMWVRTVQLASKFTLNCVTRTSARKIFKSARELLASARASLAKPLLASYMRVHAYCTSAKYSRAFVHVRT